MAYNLYQQAPGPLIRWLREEGETIHVASNTYIIEEGKVADGLFIVERGSLSIRTTRADGDSVTLAELGEGALVGEMSWLEGRPSVAHVEAQAGSRILKISRDLLQALEDGRHPVAAMLYRTIGTKLSFQVQSQNAWIHRFPASDQEPLRKVLVLFAELSEQDVDWLRVTGTLQRLPAGGVLLDQGDPVEALYLLLAGEARIQVHSDSQWRTVGSSRRGELLGEMTLLNPAAGGATARVDTTEGLELLRLDKAALVRELEANPMRGTRFWRAMARMLSQRSRDQLLDRGLAAGSRQAEQDRSSDEIDFEQMSAVTTAGVRFDWLCRQCLGQKG